MGFMEPFTYHGAYWRVETNRGGYIVPAEDVGIDASHETLSAYAPEGVGPVDADDIESAEMIRGWYGRYSAPGYMDCTDWETADTEEELISNLRDLYGDDDDSADDDDHDPIAEMEYMDALTERFPGVEVCDQNEEGTAFVGTPDAIDKMRFSLGLTIGPEEPTADGFRMLVTSADGTHIGQIDDDGRDDGSWIFSALNDPLRRIADSAS